MAVSSALLPDSNLGKVNSAAREVREREKKPTTWFQGSARGGLNRWGRTLLLNGDLTMMLAGCCECII